MRDFGFLHSGEVPHLDDLDEALADLGHFLQGLIDAQDLVFTAGNARGIHDVGHFIVDPPRSSAFSDEVDHYRSHGARRIGEKMRPIGNLDVPGSVKPQISFVDQRRGIQQRTWPGTTQPLVCDLAQIGVQKREELRFRSRVAVLDGREELGDSGHFRVRRHYVQSTTSSLFSYTESLPEGSQGDVTQLLAQWQRGDRAALDAATRIVYSELRRIAEGYLQRERGEHTLQPTALIHEAYLRLVKEDGNVFENRRKFFAFAARLMRQILVDHARTAGAQKRGGGVSRVPLNEAVDFVPDRAQEFLSLNEALDSLAQSSPRAAQVIELRYFGGLNVEEAAQVLDVSIATISREQRMAEAWLSQAMDRS